MVDSHSQLQPRFHLVLGNLKNIYKDNFDLDLIDLFIWKLKVLMILFPVKLLWIQQVFAGVHLQAAIIWLECSSLYVKILCISV